MLNPRLIALQGIGFTPITLAVQGLIAFIEDGGTTAFTAEVELSVSRRKWYVKRKNRIHIFDDAQSADSYLEAESVAEAAIQEAQKTSRRSRKRLRERVLKSYALPVETINTDWLTELVNRFSIPVNLPDLVAQQDWERVMQIQALALGMQDEEEIELLLMS